MRTRCGQVVMIALVLAALLTGCASTVSQQGTLGLPNAENPEYLAHPLRIIALPATALGYALQYIIVEPFYFAMNGVPNAVGLTLEEQRYLEERRNAWEKEKDKTFGKQ